MRRLVLMLALIVLSLCLPIGITRSDVPPWPSPAVSLAQTPDPMDVPFSNPQYLLHSKSAAA